MPTPTTPSRFRFSDKTIEHLPPHPKDARATEAEYTDTEVTGLKLLVSKSGRRFFYFRYTFAGQKRSMKIGEFGAMTVVQARKQALALRYQLDQGTDPQAQKAIQAAMPTLPGAGY